MKPKSNHSTHRPAIHAVLGESRGRLLIELCRRPGTAAELAERVGTSTNAVRVHLGGLRSAGLVDYQVARRGVGKPTHVYSLTPAAKSLLSVAYVPTLQALLAALRKRLNGEFAPLLREVGTSLGQRTGSSSRTRRGIDSAVHALASLGAPAVLETKKGQRIVRADCCPLAAVTSENPEVCQLVEQLLTAASGVEMRARCEPGEHPRCAFAPLERSHS